METKILLGLYLQEFNREYLSTAADRRQLWENVVCGFATLALIICTAFVLLVLP